MLKQASELNTHPEHSQRMMRTDFGFCCLLLVAALARGGAGQSCTFSFPSTDDPTQCEAYDLSKIASVGGANFTGAYSYVLTVCENLPSTSLPAVCRASPPSPAYQYNGDSCVAIGNLSSPFAVSADFLYKVRTLGSSRSFTVSR